MIDATRAQLAAFFARHPVMWFLLAVLIGATTNLLLTILIRRDWLS